MILFIFRISRAEIDVCRRTFKIIDFHRQNQWFWKWKIDDSRTRTRATVEHVAVNDFHTKINDFECQNHWFWSWKIDVSRPEMCLWDMSRALIWKLKSLISTPEIIDFECQNHRFQKSKSLILTFKIDVSWPRLQNLRLLHEYVNLNLDACAVHVKTLPYPLTT